MAFKAEFKLSDDDLNEIQYKLTKLQDAETTVNNVLKKSAPVMYKAILDVMPTYMGDGTRRHRAHQKHAKNSQPLKTEYENLGFSLTTKKAYGYLYFPDQGEGTSKGRAQEIMETGAEDSYDEIVDMILDAINEALNS